MLILLLIEKKGKVPGKLKQFFRYGIPASIIEELRILGRIKIESEGKKAYIILIDDAPTNEPILDGILSEIINFHNTGGTLKLAKYLKILGNKKRKWQEQLWTDLEIKGIIRNKKGKYFLTQTEMKEKLEQEIKDVVGHKIEPDETQKAIIGFFKHTRQLRFVTKKSDRDKQWVNSLTKDCLVPKIFARHVLMPAAVKRVGKMVSIAGAAGGQISSAGSQFSSSVSGAGKNLTSVTYGGKTWGGIQAKKTLKPSTFKSSGIGRSPGDSILKGVKKVKEKRSKKKEE